VFGGFTFFAELAALRQSEISLPVLDRHANSSSKALACFKSKVSKPSVNQA